MEVDWEKWNRMHRVPLRCRFFGHKYTLANKFVYSPWEGDFHYRCERCPESTYATITHGFRHDWFQTYGPIIRRDDGTVIKICEEQAYLMLKAE